MPISSFSHLSDIAKLAKLAHLTDRMSRMGRSSGAETNTRRMGHGGSAWSLPLASNALRQPQDGAPLAGITPVSKNFLLEPEDATLTGGTRSLNRRLLGLNLGTMRKSADTVNALPGGSQVRAAA